MKKMILLKKFSGSVMKKPSCSLIAQDGNIFDMVGIATRVLHGYGMGTRVQEMTDRIFASGSYEEAVEVISEYVNIC